MKIYFSASIRGGRKDVDIYHKLVDYLKRYGTVLSEFVADPTLTSYGHADRTSAEIFAHDKDMLEHSDVVIAEVSTPSLGVGYELALAEKYTSPTLCLYKPQEGKRLSAMIGGNSYFTVNEYTDLPQAEAHIDAFFKGLPNMVDESFVGAKLTADHDRT